MAHVSGNATWLDLPATTTMITAGRLEAIEGTVDALHTSEYGGTARTARPAFRAARTTNLSQPAGTDLFMTTGWTVEQDTDSGWNPSGTASYYQIPVSGRLWDLYFKLGAFGAGTSNVLSCKITLNSADVSAAIASDARTGASGETHPMAWRAGVPLTAGNRLYFTSWALNAMTYGSVFTVPLLMLVRDAGPA
jgi:hypothetical protein